MGNIIVGLYNYVFLRVIQHSNLYLFHSFTNKNPSAVSWHLVTVPTKLYLFLRLMCSLTFALNMEHKLSNNWQLLLYAPFLVIHCAMHIAQCSHVCLWPHHTHPSPIVSIWNLGNSPIMDQVTSRSFAVNVAGHTSNPQTLTCGVPQGSVFGPLLCSFFRPPQSAN